MKNVSLDTLLTTFSGHTRHPENFLGANTDLSQELKSNIKNCYDFTKHEENKTGSNVGGTALKKLIVHNFDLEQIWQQIELQNNDVMDRAIKDLSTLSVAKNKLIFKSINEEVNNLKNLKTEKKPFKVALTSHTDSSSEECGDEMQYLKECKKEQELLDNKSTTEESSSESEQERKPDNKKINGKQKGSIVDDDFFKLSEMEAFLGQSLYFFYKLKFAFT